MKLSFRGLRTRWHLLLGTKIYTLDGVKVSTDTADIPDAIIRFLFRHTYEDTERELMAQILKPDSRVLEIGCGIGLVSLVARKQCPQGSVRSYEANPRMEKIIRKNYALNGWEPDLVMKAVTDDGADLEFFIDDNILSSSSTDRGINATKTIVESDRFEKIISDFKPDTIVMDVEGAEVSLLEPSSLDGVRQMVVEIHPHIIGEETCDGLLDNLAEKGFKLSAKKGKVVLLQRD